MGKHAVDIVVTAKDMASRQFGTIGRSFGSMLGSAMRIGAAVGGVYGLVRVIKGSVSEFMNAEAAANGLASALKVAIGNDQIGEYQSFANEMQRITTFEDDATIAAMKLGVTIAQLSGEDLKAATQAAMGLSKAYNMDLETSMRLVSKAAMGVTGTFKRLGIVLNDDMTDSQKYAEIIRIGTENFKIATAETETFGGMLKQLGNAWGDAKEGIGQYIAESARLKGVFEAITFGLAHIVDVSKYVWASAIEDVKKWGMEVKKWIPANYLRIPAAVAGEGIGYLINKMRGTPAEFDWKDAAIQGFESLGYGPGLTTQSGSAVDAMAEKLALGFASRKNSQFDFGQPGGGFKGSDKALAAQYFGGAFTMETRTARFAGGQVNPVERKLDEQTQILKDLRTDSRKQTDIMSRSSGNFSELEETDF